MNIGFVFTNYNNTRFTAQAIESIFATRGEHVRQVVIVDNASNAAERAALRECQARFPAVRYVYNDKNLGYFPGLNCGLDALLEDGRDFDCVVVGNNDLVFPPEFCEQLEASRSRLAEHPVIAPDIVTLDNVHQNPHVLHPPSRLRELLWDLYFSNYRVARLMQWVARSTRSLTARTDHHDEHQAPRGILQGYGAVYLLGPRFFAEFGRLYSPTFLMGEEFFLQHQLHEKGYLTFYEPTITVRHHDHATTDKVPGRLLWSYGREAHLLYRKLTQTGLAGVRRPG